MICLKDYNWYIPLKTYSIYNTFDYSVFNKQCIDCLDVTVTI